MSVSRRKLLGMIPAMATIPALHQTDQAAAANTTSTYVPIFDDVFTGGFLGWEELVTSAQGAPRIPQSSPLSLTPHTWFGQRALLLQTQSSPDPGIGSQCVAIKRLTHQGYSKVRLDVWFAWGTEHTAGLAPRFLLFMIDEMRDGVRRFWKLRWRNAQDSPAQLRRDWWVSTAEQDEFREVPDLRAAPLPYNGNKGNFNRVALEIDLIARYCERLLAERLISPQETLRHERSAGS
ncbi:MAG: hypothetical protein EBZ48_16735 [Proteobacteria bacterium]|nr:hypothetical protein [Pseudomonadota bacterium]